MSTFDRGLTAETFARLETAKALCAAIAACHPSDAAEILAAALEYLSAGDPAFDPFGDLRADASFWAETANPFELEMYFAAALKRLGSTALGINARKRLIVALWQSLPPDGQAAFLARVDPDGKFRGKAA